MDKNLDRLFDRRLYLFDRRLYTTAAILFARIVLTGFSRTYYIRSV